MTMIFLRKDKRGTWSFLLQRGGPVWVFGPVWRHCCNDNTVMLFSLSLRISLFFRLSSLYHHGILIEVKAKVPCTVLILCSLAEERRIFDWDARYWGRGLGLDLLNRIMINFYVFITFGLLNGGKSIRIWLDLIRYRDTNFKICICCRFRWTNIHGLFSDVLVIRI